MSTMERGQPAQDAPREAAPVPTYLDVRRVFASHYLSGEGLEIGALHLPLQVPPQARVRYVDRMSAADLRREYVDLSEWKLTEVDVIDDGEKLATIDAESQDFIVANHFLEHCENPIGTIETHLGKLKPGGVLFYAVPDKRHTFDFRRPPTPIEEMVADYEQGPERSRAAHYDEWTQLVTSAMGEGEHTEQEIEARARALEASKYSIHMHVWTQAEFLELLLHCRRRFDDAFDIEAAARTGIEFVVILRKRGDFPHPSVPASSLPPGAPAPTLPPGTSELDVWKARGRRAWTIVRNDIRRWRARP